MKSSLILKHAKTVIQYPAKWTFGTTARDSYGQPIDPESPAATQWDMTGVLTYVGASLNVPLDKPLFYLRQVVGGEGLSDFNDTHTHREVMIVFDEAIQLATLDDD